MYVMNTIVFSGTDAQKQRYLPRIAAGELRVQSMGVTGPPPAATPPSSRPRP